MAKSLPGQLTSIIVADKRQVGHNKVSPRRLELVILAHYQKKSVRASELLDYARHCRFSAPGQENLL